MLAVGDTPALADKVDGLLFLVEPDVVRKQQLVQAREQLDKLPCALLGRDHRAPQAGAAPTRRATTTARPTMGSASAPAARPARQDAHDAELTAQSERKAYHPACARRSRAGVPSRRPSPGSARRPLVSQQEPHQQLDLTVARRQPVGLREVARLLLVSHREPSEAQRSAGCVAVLRQVERLAREEPQQGPEIGQRHGHGGVVGGWPGAARREPPGVYGWCE